MKISTDKKLLFVGGAILTLVCLLVSVLAISLSFKPGDSSENYDLESASISLERGPCFGFCPVYKVTIHGSGKVELSGIENVKAGFFTYTISKTDAQELIKSAIDMSFFNLKDSYRDEQITDLDSSIIELKANGKVKTISLYGFPPQVPQSLIDLATKIDKVTGAKERLQEGSTLTDNLYL